MTDDEWERQRRRAVMAAFQTGRPVFAGTDGVLRYTDGAREQVPDDVGVAKQPVPRATALGVRAARASQRVFIMSIVAAVINAIVGLWHPWHFALTFAFVGNAVLWRRINRHQRTTSAGVDAQEGQ